LYYLIQATTTGERIVFQGERSALLSLAQQLRVRNPQLALRVADRPLDLHGTNLLEKLPLEDSGSRPECFRAPGA
jgi:hypothetical protein